ncbi:hypothetical protein [Sphingosinicella sp. YJ22]|uniref:hypothetical protein n=1 Tax=Sphingosinicella sp. YJ22 TaxID=1104780 RepID=UPI00140E74CD|nr:hypothetical protein [Sphingosinicella sp. YJ22]
MRKEQLIPTEPDRAARRDRQTKEAEENQRQLRASIATSQRLAGEAEAMIRRHRDECRAEEDSAGAAQGNGRGR